ncbi:MAG TPA: 16S rRNA (guanine(966)-N(2))-methyltransferase RsmD [Thermodesulfobacteriota bacterium]|nr:16S rRNA (guanine(966)-N(2))-methyltransferase RsmD [Thermodesulfobacteriota bacterium]
MRIIAGRYKGHRLASLKGTSTRPTRDRIREAVFNILEPKGPFLQIADFFAGSGAMGLEALSRWGGRALFVDSSQSALECIRGNIIRLKLEGRAEVLKRDLRRGIDFLKASARSFDLVFVDPPYSREWSALILPSIFGLPLLNAKGVLVLEHDAKDPVPRQIGSWEAGEARQYGRTKISIYQSSSQPSTDE